MNLQNQLKKAYEFAKLGNFNEAKITLEKVLKKFPNHFDALVNCGFIELKNNNLSNAKNYFYKALDIKLDLKILDNLSELLKHNHEWDEIIDLRSKYYSTNYLFELNFAIALRQKNYKEESLEKFKELFEAHNDNVNSYISYGFTLNFFQLFDEAIKIYKEGLALDPDNYYLNYNLGVTYANNEDPTNSIIFLKKSISQNKENFDAWITLAAQQIKKRMLNEALDSIQKCKEIDPNNSLIIFQTAVIQMKNGDIENAKRLLKKFLEIDPENPDGNYHLGLCMLYEQDYKHASKYYRYRIKTKNAFGRFDDLDLPELKKDSKIIIGWEQGIGDQLLFLRLLPSFIKKYKNVTYITTDKLYDIVKSTFKEIKIIKTSECENIIQNSKDHLKINLGSLINYENNVEYSLKLSRELNIERQYNLPSQLSCGNKKIGLSWSSNNKSIGKDKSISLSEYQPILEITNLNFINLQYGEVFPEIENIQNKLNIKIHFDQSLDYFNDLAGLAALIKQCDYVITTSNVTAHFAGSLGIKTFVLVPKSHGKLWYWFSKNDKCIWYPTIKIIHQEEDGAWSQEIEKIKKLII